MKLWKKWIWLRIKLFFKTPPWSSDRDPRRSFPRLQTFRPYEAPYVFGGRAASSDHSYVPVGFYLSDLTLSSAMRLSLAFLCRSLLPGLERLWKLSLASLCRLLHCLEADNLLLCEALFGLLNWDLNFLCSGSREIEIFLDSATGFYSTPFGW